MRPDGPRADYAGPESGPEMPFPIKLQGPVIKGFGRGSKEVGWCFPCSLLLSVLWGWLRGRKVGGMVRSGQLRPGGWSLV